MPAFHPDPSPHQLTRGAWLTAAGDSHKQQGAGIHRPTGLDQPACIFITRGRLRLTTANGHWRVHHDGMIWLLPGQEHRYHADPSSDEFWFICDGPAMHALVNQRIRAEHPICEQTDDAMRLAIHRAWAAIQEHHPRANEIATLAIEEVLARHEAPLPSLASDDGLVIAARRLIEAADGQISPAVIADELAVSYAELRGRFKRVCGETMVAACTRTRMRQAKRLLAETDLSVGAIAEHCAYDDPFFFARQFRKHTGSSPSAFRNGCRLD